jgi:hypothetical protein
MNETLKRAKARLIDVWLNIRPSNSLNARIFVRLRRASHGVIMACHVIAAAGVVVEPVPFAFAPHVQAPSPSEAPRQPVIVLLVWAGLEFRDRP